MDIETFRTSNLNEIAILLSTGKKYISLEEENSRITFIFEFDNCKKIIQSYYNKEKIVSPFDFATSLQSAKDIIFGADRKWKRNPL